MGEVNVYEVSKIELSFFSSHWPWPELLILLEKLTTPQVGDWSWKTSSANYASGVGDFMILPFFKKIFSGDLFFDVLIIGIF